MLDWTGRAALRCLADLPPGLCLPEDLSWATGDGAAALPGRRTHVLSFSPKLELDVRGLQVYLCPQKKSSRTETVVLGAMQLKRLGRRG